MGLFDREAAVYLLRQQNAILQLITDDKAAIVTDSASDTRDSFEQFEPANGTPDREPLAMDIERISLWLQGQRQYWIDDSGAPLQVYEWEKDTPCVHHPDEENFRLHDYRRYIENSKAYRYLIAQIKQSQLSFGEPDLRGKLQQTYSEQYATR